jgi:hypothetical protein
VLFVCVYYLNTRSALKEALTDLQAQLAEAIVQVQHQLVHYIRFTWQIYVVLYVKSLLQICQVQRLNSFYKARMRTLLQIQYWQRLIVMPLMLSISERASRAVGAH